MTRTKTNKLVAILMAVLMAFAFMSFSLTYVSAEDPSSAPASDTASSDNASQQETPKAQEETPKAQEETPKAQEETLKTQEETPKANEQTTPAPAPDVDYSLTKYTYGAPDVEIIIDFGNNTTPNIDYAKTTDVNVMKTIADNIKIYSDKAHTKEVKYTGVKYSNLKYENKKVTFTVPLNKSSGLSANTTYYLWIGKALNTTKEVEPYDDAIIEIKTNPTTTSAKKTTYRTVSTTRTVKAKSANTGDSANLPLWIGLAAVAGLMMGAVYFAREKE